MAKSDKKQTTPDTLPQMEKEPTFVSKYANNVRFEATVHDLKIVFGETDQSSGKEVIRQHTAITIPWSVAKLARYFIDINTLFHELYVGRIPVPPNQIPQPLLQPSSETLANDPLAEEAFLRATRLREEFLESINKAK